MRNSNKICFVAPLESSVSAFLVSHLRELATLYDITVITNTANPDLLLNHGVKARVIRLKITRKINVLFDLYCLIKLLQIFFTNNFSSVHSIGPKAGMLAMIASTLVGVPLRIHSFTGQVWVTAFGVNRFILKSIDKLIGAISTHNIVDSPSQRDFLVEQGVLSFNKAIVFGIGSIAGVDLLRFKTNKRLGHLVKKELEIANEAFVFLYLGRLVIDKGILDLAKAFSRLNDPNAFLLIVGPDEGRLSDFINDICVEKSHNLRLIGFTNDPYKYLSSANVLCLPSYREGFGNVIIEAAAMGIPAIASEIYGITDATIHNKTGLLHQPGNVDGLLKNMEKLLQDQPLLERLGRSAKRRAIENFDSKKVTGEWLSFYQKHLT